MQSKNLPPWHWLNSAEAMLIHAEQCGIVGTFFSQVLTLGWSGHMTLALSQVDPKSGLSTPVHQNSPDTDCLLPTHHDFPNFLRRFFGLSVSGQVNTCLMSTSALVGKRGCENLQILQFPCAAASASEIALHAVQQF